MEARALSLATRVQAVVTVGDELKNSSAGNKSRWIENVLQPPLEPLLQLHLPRN